MATSVIRVISEFCDIYVDDERIGELLDTDKPLYFRQTYYFFRSAIALFTHPHGIQEYLLGTPGEPRYVEPEFSDTEHTVTEEEAGKAEVAISLGDDFAAFDLCACRLREVGRGGVVQYYPISCDYADDGTVAVHAGSEDGFSSGDVLEFDFARDGYFEHDLTHEMMDILGTAFGVMWQERFNTDWLSLVPKAEDKSFKEQNRASKEKADTERIQELRRSLAGKMRHLEQGMYYKSIVPQTMKIQF